MALSTTREVTGCANTQEILNIVMESKDSLPCSQEPSTDPHLE
jgi:hypothetical protein